MSQGRLSALSLLAELSAQPGHAIATRIGIGMCRDALLALDEVEPEVLANDQSLAPINVGDVVATLERLIASLPSEEERLRIALSWLRRPIL